MRSDEKTFVAVGGPEADLSDDELEGLFSEALARALEAAGSGPAALLPPDGTRFHSKAGFLTDIAARDLMARREGDRLGFVMPALGTHMAMTEAELRRMFPGTPLDRFRPHDWRNDGVELGRLEAEFGDRVSAGSVRPDWPVQVKKAEI